MLLLRRQSAPRLGLLLRADAGSGRPKDNPLANAIELADRVRRGADGVA
jgi:hypothetical protein